MTLDEAKAIGRAMNVIEDTHYASNFADELNEAFPTFSWCQDEDGNWSAFDAAEHRRICETCAWNAGVEAT